MIRPTAVVAFLLLILPTTTQAQEPDWLIDGSPYIARAGLSADGRDLVLTNGLVRRVWRLAPEGAGACIALDDLVGDRSLLRAVRPEARLTLDGVELAVGGLDGQPNHAFLTDEWLTSMTLPATAFRLVGWEQGEPVERFAWKRVRHHAPDAVWPPQGVHLQLHYELPEIEDAVALFESGAGEELPAVAPPSDVGRRRLLFDDFTTLDPEWRAHVTEAHARSSCENEGKRGEIMTPANSAVFVERTLPDEARLVEATLDVGTDRSASWGPGIALVFEKRVVKLNLRPESNAVAMLGLWDGVRENPRLGGRQPVDVSRPWQLRMRWSDSTLHADARPLDGAWRTYARIALDGEKPVALRVGKMDRQGGDSDHGDLGSLARCRILDVATYGDIDAAGQARARARVEALRQVKVTVHVELYDGVPVMSKWLTVHNRGDAPITLDGFASEILAVVEHANWVEAREGVALPRPETLHVETDFAFGGFHHENSSRHVVHWRRDPQYSTQVNYLRQSPCLLVVEPTYGPAQTIAADEVFESMRAFELVHDSSDRERRGLAVRRMYRTIAPWVTENPLMMHMRSAAPAQVRAAIDQCAAVGFEMLILSFGSGFNIENEDPEYLKQWREIADYAQSKGIEIGGYSLLSSRRIGGGNDVVSPAGQRPTHGSCPALTSEWGQDYFRKLHAFFEATGFRLLEHDGSYPGDVDVTPRPPLQKGEADSRWAQWRIIRDFYRWCRGQGIYLNVPDYYFLAGSNKCGMGYREVNWSLPRDQQVIHTRQNIFDGTWSKTPSMGWMFVPLTEYHGGGAAATIEPLAEHLDHYGRMIDSNLGLGVQACYRGPRLFDAEETRRAVAERVAWFKRYRDILESDVVHGRRADGRHLDWMLHVNPKLEEKGMLVVYNPLDREVVKTIRVDLTYTGRVDSARVAIEDVEERVHPLARDHTVPLTVRVPARGFTWAVIR